MKEGMKEISDKIYFLEHKDGVTITARSGPGEVFLDVKELIELKWLIQDWLDNTEWTRT